MDGDTYPWDIRALNERYRKLDEICINQVSHVVFDVFPTTRIFELQQDRCLRFRSQFRLVTLSCHTNVP